MLKNAFLQHSGHVGRRGSIVLPSATRKRYGLDDGSLFISEEREDGILIRPASAIPADLSEVRLLIQAGLDEIKAGKTIPGDKAEAELIAMSKEFRKKVGASKGK